MIAALLLACAADPEPRAADSGRAEAAVDCSARPWEGVPTARAELASVWDPIAERMLLIGGNAGVPELCGYAPSLFTDEVWAWHADCGSFAQVDAAGGPGPRGRMAAAYDPDGHRALLHGGRTRADGASGDYALSDELWALDLHTDAWTLLSEGAGPAARVSHAAWVWGGKLWVHGGNSSASGAAYVAHDDLWSYDLAAGTWQQEATAGGPSARLFHATTQVGDAVYAYGGGDERAFTGPFLGGLWRLDLPTLTWTELHDGAGDAPRGRLGAAMSYDLEGDRLLVFGGHDDGELGNTNQVWSWHLTRERWREVRSGDTYANPPADFCDFPADFTAPDLDSPERRYLGTAATTGDGRMLVFGGKTDCGVINDLWSLDLASGTWAEQAAASSGEICLRTSQACTSLCF